MKNGAYTGVLTINARAGRANQLECLADASNGVGNDHHLSWVRRPAVVALREARERFTQPARVGVSGIATLYRSHQRFGDRRRERGIHLGYE